MRGLLPLASIVRLAQEDMRPHLEELSKVADTLICAYPNAGLPNAFGGYDETAAQMAASLDSFASAGLLNIVGGCCGTTPDHIAAIKTAALHHPPRAVPHIEPLLRLSGLEPFALTKDIPFVNIGERTNVTGSAKFRKLIKNNEMNEALAIARQQVEAGAQIIDINMDEGLLDSELEMVNFLNLIASEPDISRVPFMIDSSKWSIIEAGLKCSAGQMRHQFNFLERRRATISRSGAACTKIWRSCCRDGIRREGPG